MDIQLILQGTNLEARIIQIKNKCRQKNPMNLAFASLGNQHTIISFISASNKYLLATNDPFISIKYSMGGNIAGI